MTDEDPEKPWRDEETLRELYWDEEMSAKEMAEEWGCAKSTVNRWMEKHDIPRRSQPEAQLLQSVSRGVRDREENETLYSIRREQHLDGDEQRA